MSWSNLLDIGSPLVFCPKVAPDPNDAERLQEKRQQAMRNLNMKPNYPQRLESVPGFKATSISRMG